MGFIGFSPEKIQFGAVGDSGFLIFHSHGIIGVGLIFLIDVYFISNCFRFTRNTRKVDRYVYSCFKILLILFLFYYLVGLKISVLYARTFYPTILIFYMLLKEYSSIKSISK